MRHTAAFVVLLQLQVCAGVTLSSLRGSEYPSDLLRREDSFTSDPPVVPFTNNVSEFGHKLVDLKCEDKNISLPSIAVVIRNGSTGQTVAWCPNPKVGTSTFYNAIFGVQKGQEIHEWYEAFSAASREWGSKHTVEKIISGRKPDLNIDFSFMFLRNPWDRVLSAYLDKINRVAFVPGHPNATFAEFLYALNETEPERMNAHWQPASIHCGINQGANYTKMYKIEDNFEDSIADVFSHLGIDREHTLEVLNVIGDRNHNGGHDSALDARREAYNSPELRQIVEDLYAEDIKLGDYSFDK